MSMSAIIRRGEILIKRWVSPEHEIKPKQVQTLSDILQLRLELEDTTFGQFFALIANEKSFFEKLFQCSMMGHPIQPYIDECARPAKTAKDLDFDHVEVSWDAQLFDGDFDLCPSFGGWGDWGPQFRDSEGTPKKGACAVEFTPLNHYKDLELKLDPKVEIFDGGPKETKVIAVGSQRFTVYDVVNAILEEITWAGDISGGRGDPLDEPAAPGAV